MNPPIGDIPFIADLGVEEVIDPHDGSATLRLRLQRRHFNRREVAHGGVVMSLLDTAMARAARTADGSGRAMATIEMKSSFLAPGRGELSARAVCVHRTGTLAFCEGEIRDAEGMLVARGSATLRYLTAR